MFYFIIVVPEKGHFNSQEISDSVLMNQGKGRSQHTLAEVLRNSVGPTIHWLHERVGRHTQSFGGFPQKMI